MHPRMSPELERVFRDARECRLCWGDAPRNVPLPDPQNGLVGVDVLFVCERPGRVGTLRSGYVSFDNDDASARFFKELLGVTRIRRERIFITNAVLCHPLTDGYRDAPPRPAELRNCVAFLERQVAATNPRLIVALGGVALRSLQTLFRDCAELQAFTLGRAVGAVVHWQGRAIYPLYHHSMRGRMARPARLQRQDWQEIPCILETLRAESPEQPSSGRRA